MDATEGRAVPSAHSVAARLWCAAPPRGRRLAGGRDSPVKPVIIYFPWYKSWGLICHNTMGDPIVVCATLVRHPLAWSGAERAEKKPGVWRRTDQRLENGMSEIERMDSLRDRHLTLDEQLKTEIQRPLPNAEEISRLKREKLKLKDEIFRLSAESADTQVGQVG